jgi:hypothetical protein
MCWIDTKIGYHPFFCIETSASLYLQRKILLNNLNLILCSVHNLLKSSQEFKSH